MKRHIGIVLVCFCAFLFGCNSKPVPVWTERSYDHLKRFREYFMVGEDRVAEAHFQKAIDEIRKSGDFSILQRAYLTECAIHLAVLEPLGGDEYLQLEAVEPVAENRNFFSFLRASPAAQVSAELLPVQYREVFTVFSRGEVGKEYGAVAKIDDPLSRLIAIGWLVTQGRHGEEILLMAVDTASHQGWKKALLVYLDKLRVLYSAKNETRNADAVMERIRLIKK